MASPSVLMPLGMALESVRRILFQPFNLVKWLGLGFTAWLAALAKGLGTNFNFNPAQCSKAQTSQCGRLAWEWIQAHLVIVLPLAVLLVAAVIVIYLLVLWVSSRGKFMFLDNVIGNRAEIVLPWQKFRTQGNSYFLFLICFGLAAVAVAVLGVVLVLLLGWPDISRSHFGWYALVAAAAGVIFLFCFIITLTCLAAFLDDFIVPIMAVKGCRIMEGWSIFFDLFRQQAGIFILYLLFRVVLSMAIGMIGLLLCCLLCCVVLIPYVGTVILLPLHVFWRSYSVYFLGQFDDKLKMFANGSAAYITLAPRRID